MKAATSPASGTTRASSRKTFAATAQPTTASSRKSAATLSPSYGVYSGYELIENTPLKPGSEEYLHSEKYQIRVRDWDAAGNINADIALVNRIRHETPALQRYTNLTFHTSENDQILFYRKAGAGKAGARSGGAALSRRASASA